MKTIAVILSVLFLALSAKPCADGTNAEDLQEGIITNNHNHQNDTDDTCPIMCVCTCCGMAMTYQPVKSFRLLANTAITTTVQVTYQSNYRFDFLSNIWQPPQLNY